MSQMTQLALLSVVGQVITGLVMLVGLIVVAIKARGKARVLGALGLGLGLLRVVYGSLQFVVVRAGDPDGFLDRMYLFNFLGTLLSLVWLGLVVAGIASHARDQQRPAPVGPHPGAAVPGGPQAVPQRVQQPGVPQPQQPGWQPPQTQQPVPMPQPGGLPAFPQQLQPAPGQPQPGTQQPPAPRP